MDPFLNISDVKKIHLRLAKHGSKCITIIEGLDDDLDLKRISRAMKATFKCAATIMKSKDGEVIQLQGDHRDSVKIWLVDSEILTKQEGIDRILVHGG
jgi:translation initiation factor 1